MLINMEPACFSLISFTKGPGLRPPQPICFWPALGESNGFSGSVYISTLPLSEYIIGMQMTSIEDYPGRSGSWHKAGGSSRLAEAGVRSWFWSYSSGLEPGGEQKQDND